MKPTVQEDMLREVHSCMQLVMQHETAHDRNI